MSGWLVPESDLSPEQLRLVHLDPTRNQVIFGPPGAGKSTALLHRARYLVQRYRLPPGRVKIIVPGPTLRNYLTVSLAPLGLPQDCVSTFSAWVARFYVEQKIEPRLTAESLRRLGGLPGVAERVWDHVRKARSPGLDLALVDLGMDLPLVLFRVLGRVAHHVTVVVDDLPTPGLGRGSLISDISLILDPDLSGFQLAEGSWVAPLARLVEECLLGGGEEPGLESVQGERETPLLYLAADYSDEVRRLAQVIRARLARGERLAVLLPRRRKLHRLALALRAAGLEVETPPWPSPPDRCPALDFATARPKLLTYSAVRGLSFDSILLPRLTSQSFTGLDPEAIPDLLSFAIQRATRWVYLSADSRQGPLAELGRLQGLIRRGVVVEQRAATWSATLAGLKEDRQLSFEAEWGEKPEEAPAWL